MNVTRDVVRDLWPLVSAGEASPDSRSLVEEFLREDGALERELRAAAAFESEAVAAPVPAPDAERRGLQATKRTLRRERRFLVGGAVLAAIPPLVTEAHLNFERWGLGTAFSKLPAWENTLALACLGASLACWLTWFSLWRRLRLRGF